MEEELNLVMVGLTRVACESIEAMHDITENSLGGSGDSLDFADIKDLADEVIMCADAARRCTMAYAAEAHKMAKASENAQKSNDGKETKGNGKKCK